MSNKAYNRGTDLIIRSLPNSGSVAVNHPAAEPVEPVKKPFKVGETVYCTVRQLKGKRETVTAVKRGYIKVSGCAVWCPETNFSHTDPLTH